MKKKRRTKTRRQKLFKKLEKFIRLMVDKLEKLIHRQPPQCCHLSPHPPLTQRSASSFIFFFSFFFFGFLCKTRRSENVTNECRVCLNFWVSFSGSSLTTNERTKRRRDAAEEADSLQAHFLCEL